MKTVRQLLRDLRLFVSARKISVKVLSALLVLLSLIGLASSLKSNAANEITDKRYKYTYFTDGDFQQMGLDKQLMFYEYLPDNLSWDTLQQMVANFTADGVRLEYRILGYKSGGGGTLVFDSGDNGSFGQAVDIQGANFDYYNIYLSAFDEDGVQQQVGHIDSGYVIFSWGELVQLPTTPPELVDGVQSIEEGINGTVTVTRPPSNITTATIPYNQDPDDIATDLNDAAWNSFLVIQRCFHYLFYDSIMQIRALMFACIALTVIGFILSKGW